MEPVIDHVPVTVRDLRVAESFYDKLLPLLGFDLDRKGTATRDWGSRSAPRGVPSPTTLSTAGDPALCTIWRSGPHPAPRSTGCVFR